MKQLFLFIAGLLTGTALLTVTACSDDDDTPAVATPTAQGTFLDERDSTLYHWVRYGSLDWMAENATYFKDTIGIDVYQPAWWNANYSKDYGYRAKYGCLYSVASAVAVTPAGWRVPTDADWQNLERAFGMSVGDAASRGWRGNIALNMMLQQDNYGGINILPTGYFTNKTGGQTTGYRLLGSEGFYWTSTIDTVKNGSEYFYRKFFYTKKEVWRESTESGNILMSVRWVRDAQ